MQKEALELLRCPESRQPLLFADPDTVSRINTQIKSGAAKNRAGKTVTEPIDGGLVREDRKMLYPIRGEIPVLLIGEAIPLQAAG